MSYSEPTEEYKEKAKLKSEKFLEIVNSGNLRLPGIYRNHSCPCGSGKKIKKCCWLTPNK